MAKKQTRQDWEVPQWWAHGLDECRALATETGR